MTIQSIRRRRLAIVAFTLLALVGSLAALYAHRQNQLKSASLAHREAGMTAVEQGDNSAVLDHLGAYLRRHDQDVEALYEYARARRRIEAPRGRHLTEAIGVLQRVVDLAPSHADAQHDLLDLYSFCGYNHETIDLADDLLAADDRNAQVWRAKAVALARMRQLPAAKIAAEQCLARNPYEVRAAVLLMDLRQQLGASGAQLMESARSHRQQHPTSPIADLLEAYAHRLAGNSPASIELLRAAAAGTVVDAAYGVMLVMLLDESRLATESMAVLEKASHNRDDENVRTELVRRLWESNRFKEVEARLASLDPLRRDSSDVLLGLRAASLYELGRPLEAQVITTALKSRGADSIGTAWAMVLDAVYRAGHRTPHMIIAACNDALGIDPSNACFAYMQGAAWWSLGETDLALASWKTSVKLRPSWITPRILSVHAYLAAGQTELSQREARQAIERSPQRVDAIAAWVVAHAATLTPDDVERAQQLLPAAAAVQRTAPYEPQTLPLYIALQAQCGKPDIAADRLRQVLAHAPPLDESTWLKLAAVSQNYGLKLEAQCHEKIHAKYGMTPGLALAKANALAANGSEDEGRSFLLAASAAAPDRLTLAWRMAIGRYLDQINDSSALEHWIAVADDNADDARVQSWALQTRCMQRDQDAQVRLIERLRHLSGPQAVTWRLARARKLLAGDGGDQAATEAAALLQGVVAEAPNSLSAQVLLARSLVRVKLDSKASAQIIGAARVQPQSVELALEAARILQHQLDYAGARGHLHRVADRGDRDATTTARIAAMLARQGDDVVAIRLLDELAKDTPLTDHHLLLLGALVRRQGDSRRVASVIGELMKAPTIKGIEFAADYHQSIGDPITAKAILGRLDALPMTPSARWMLLAGHEQRFGLAEKSLDMWTEAVKADPTLVEAHRSLLAQCVRAKQLPRLFVALDAARRAFPNDAMIQDLAKARALIEWAAGKSIVQPLLLLMMQSESQQPVLSEALETMKGLTSENRTASFARLRALCMANMDGLALLTVVVQLHVAEGRADDVIGIASRAISAHPTAWEAPWIQSEVLGALGRWDEALASAQEWRRRAPIDTLLSDMMIAEAYHRLNRPADAVKQLAPHLPRAVANLEHHGDLLWRLARSQIATGNVAAAEQSLVPLWKEATWRRRSIDLALQGGIPLPLAMEWLDRMTTHMPADAAIDNTRLAATWLELGGKFKSVACRQKAQKILNELVKQPAAASEAWFLLGMLAEQNVDSTAAVNAYRQALKLSPDMGVACNNLAMLLSADDSQLDEALVMADRAVGLSPRTPAYLDTLAHVQHRLRRHDDAVATARRAVDLQPGNPQWTARLAALQIERDQLRTGPR